jgi:hypothetical protein
MTRSHARPNNFFPKENKMRKLITLLIAVLSVFALAQACDEHYIKSIADGGRIIILDDGTIYKSLDSVTSSIWLPISEVVVCDDKIINTDDGETVDVIQLH